MRILLPAAATLIFCMGASAQSYSHEPDTYRHGGTYSTIQSSSEEACAETCRADTKCLVWSFRKPNTAAGPSQCELKQTIGHAEENPLMTSGVSPRFSQQQQAAARLDTSDLLGATSTAPRTVSHSSTRPVGLDRISPIERTTVSSQIPHTPSGRVLSPNDPRIVRNGSTQAAIPVASQPARSTLPPPPRTAPQQPAALAQEREARPYDNLRNREFPRYSVQETRIFEDDLSTDETVEAGEAAAGAGS